VDFRENGYLGAHQAFKRLWTTDPSFHGLATERYWELRGTIFNPDSIIARFQAYFNEMKSCGADLREIRRWGYTSDLAGRELNFDTELEYLRDWWTRHIAFLDTHVFIPYPLGDVNFDRVVNVNDVTILIDYMLGNQDTCINVDKADYTRDGVINMADIIDIIDVLFQQTAP
jgi:hypothetical protein